MLMADTISHRSLCSRAQVGAVIVSSDNRVVSASYNGPPPNFTHLNRPCTEWCPRAKPGLHLDPLYDDCPATHAEMSAIARADWSNCAGATIYVTGAMCMSCAKVIPQTGITRVVQRVREVEAHRNPESVESFLFQCGIAVERYEP
jgi:dCMP deaminase